jgi:chlorobactene glucosyltransferase
VSRISFQSLSWALAAVQVLRLLWVLLQKAVLRPIRPLPEPPLPAERKAYPSVSVVIPARNEQAVIAGCLEGALVQNYPGLEVLVVDDRSEDATAEIVRRYAAADPRLRLVEGQSLPAGWLGKPWALDQGSRAARGVWLLFVDADTRLLPGSVAGSVAEALRRDVPVLSALTAQLLPTVWERVIQPAVFAAIAEAMPVLLVNRPEVPQIAVANGQYLLVRRDVYEAIGGHGAVRGEIAEDAAFAKRVKTLGWRYWLGDGRDLAVTRMYATPRALWEGWTKNLHTGFKLLPWLVPPGTVYLIAVLVAPYAGFALAWRRRRPGLALAAAVQLGVSLGVRYLTDRTFGLPARYTLTQPIGQVAFLVLLAASFYKVITGQGVTWKGRRYLERA